MGERGGDGGEGEEKVGVAVDQERGQRSSLPFRRAEKDDSPSLNERSKPSSLSLLSHKPTPLLSSMMSILLRSAKSAHPIKIKRVDRSPLLLLSSSDVPEPQPSTLLLLLGHLSSNEVCLTQQRWVQVAELSLLGLGL